MISIHQIRPDITETLIIDACIEGGFEPDIGMLPQQIYSALDILDIGYSLADMVRLKPTHGQRGDMRTNMTLQQALILTSDDVCLIRVTGHVLASNRGIPLDPNVGRRGSRRRVLGIVMIHDATIEARRPWIKSDNPMIQFVRDLRSDTQKGSYRFRVYDAVMKHISDPTMPVRFQEIRHLGYTKKMLRRHYERGDVQIIIH